jgi:hypothetical protein
MVNAILLCIAKKRSPAQRIKSKDNRYILTLMITSGYKGFGCGGIVFPSILPRVSAPKKWLSVANLS